MKKGKIKSAIRKAFLQYYESGLTNTGNAVMKKVLKDIDNCYYKYHNKK